ncbi:21793_t:CDS:2, partial [Dentiscutata erythropus]
KAMADELSHDALRKCKSRENETPEQCQKRLARDRENKSKKKNAESAEEHRKRLDKEKEQRQKWRALNSKKSLNTADVRLSLNNQENEQTMPSALIDESDRKIFEIR